MSLYRKSPCALTVGEEGRVCVTFGFPARLQCTFPVMRAGGTASFLHWDNSSGSGLVACAWWAFSLEQVVFPGPSVLVSVG